MQTYDYLDRTTTSPLYERIVKRMHLDLPLLLALILLCGIGLMALYSASEQNINVMEAQIKRLSIGFIAMLVAAQIPPRYYQLSAPWLFAIGLSLLIAVLLIGDVNKGAQRWIRVGGFGFQPSELMKLFVPLMVAWYFSDRPLPPQPVETLIATILVVVPVLLVARQPDLGTALLIGSSGFAVLWLSGLRISTTFFLLLFASACAPLFWILMKDYQRQRVLTLLNPESDPLGTGYHIIQSKIAIGSGGLYGKGWLNGTQSHLEFLPERSTDFIFAVFSEEFGLFGIIFLMAIYLFIIIRGMLIAIHSQDSFTRLLVGGLIYIFFVYAFVNMGMVSGLLPVVGLPLPLVSYGGTSLVTLLLGFGMLMSAHTHRRLLSS